MSLLGVIMGDEQALLTITLFILLLSYCLYVISSYRRLKIIRLQRYDILLHLLSISAKKNHFFLLLTSQHWQRDMIFHSEDAYNDDEQEGDDDRYGHVATEFDKCPIC